MRHSARLILPALLALSFLFQTACVSTAKSAEKTAEEVRALYTGKTVSFTADIRADYGEKMYEYKIDYDGGSSTMTVVEPELIAGVKITLKEGEDGTVLSFDGAQLDTGALTEDGLSPISALPAIVKLWTNGYVVSCYFETVEGVDTVAVKTEVSQEVTSTTWFDRTNGVPLKSEIASGDYVVIECTLSNVNLT